jgi:hypothetical protein
MDREGQGSVGRVLVAFGAAALVAALVFRAVASELDLSPAVTVLIAWAVLTGLFMGAALLRRRAQPPEEDEDEGEG